MSGALCASAKKAMYIKVDRDKFIVLSDDKPEETLLRLSGGTILTTKPVGNEISIQEPVDQLKRIGEELSSRLVAMEDPIKALLIAAAAGQNIFFVSPPGTAKSTLARLFAEALNASFWSIIMNPDVSREDLFGAVDPVAYAKEGVWRRKWAGLAKADIALLDEFFKGSPQAVNMVLGAIEEKIVHSSDGDYRIPLFMAIAASNETPPSGDFAAAWDRLTMRVSIGYVADDNIGPLVTAEGHRAPMPQTADINMLRLLAGYVDWFSMREGKRSDVVEMLMTISRDLKKDGIVVSNRRWIRSLQVVGANAILAGRDRITPKDFSVLRWTLWSDLTQEPTVREYVLGVSDAVAKEVMKIEAAIADLQAALKTIANMSAQERMEIIAKARRVQKAIQESDISDPEYKPRIDECLRAVNEIIGSVVDSIA